jgi:hypothetical protein
VISWVGGSDPQKKQKDGFLGKKNIFGDSPSVKMNEKETCCNYLDVFGLV